MSVSNNTHNNIQSVLQMSHVVFDKIHFDRKGFYKEQSEVNIQASTEINDEGHGRYRVVLNVVADKQDEYTAEVQITGYCTIAENYPEKDIMLKKNAVAILFPYVRAELSLLTAQPETDPIVLPVMNIAAMLDNSQ